jgi:type IV fimbrial biogenesis protein FimT
LLELMIVMAIIAIIFAMALPSYDALIQKSQQTIAAKKLLSVINLAKDEAILRRQSIILCGSEDGHSCSVSWIHGQLILAADAHSYHVLHYKKISLAHQQLSWRSSLGKTYLQFNASGSSDFQSGAFVLADEKSQQPLWKIMVNAAGRARLVVLN